MARAKQQLRGSVTQNVSNKATRRGSVDMELSPLARIMIFVMLIAVVGGICYELWQTGWINRQVHIAGNLFIQSTQKADFAITDVVVEGRKQTDKDELLAALNVTHGSPILNFDPDEAVARIAQLPWISKVVVLRRLPDTIYVHLTEREPTALWQHDGHTTIIDREGKELPSMRLDNRPFLPLVAGEDAPAAAPDLIDALKKYPNIAQAMQSAVRVSERRWNLYVGPHILVKLPEHDIERALQRLSQLMIEQKILDRDIVAIDLRLADRYFLEKRSTATRPDGK